MKNEVKTVSGVVSRIFAPQTLLTTTALWVSFFLGLPVVYLLLNWMPQLLVARGLTRNEAERKPWLVVELCRRLIARGCFRRAAAGCRLKAGAMFQSAVTH